MRHDSTEPLTGMILEIQRMSTEDGPGIRTTVFFKGCSLKCSWCHNPESIARQPQLHWIGNRCIGCRSCLEVCPNQALTLSTSGMAIHRERCAGCGSCAAECPSTALEIMGKTWRVDELMAEVIKDQVYFDKSAGGVTLSGGEPGLQPQFAAAFLKALKERGIQTAFDTCGLCSRSALEMILPYASLVLFDMKVMDRDAHRRLTGSDNDRILSNLAFTAAVIRSHVHPKSMWIRTPIIPGATDSDANIRAIGAWIADNIADTMERWELCGFNHLCRDKYHRLGLNWEFESAQPLRRETMEHLANTARASGVDPGIVHWSGATRLDETGEAKPNHAADLQVVNQG
jgi:pyruvate formate lyase activating enzyme